MSTRIELDASREAFTALFACSRTVGWAHVAEQGRVGGSCGPGALRGGDGL